MTKRIDQWAPALHSGDAIGDSTLLMRDALRSWGYVSDIYTYNQDPGLFAATFDEWREGGAEDIVILHYALISPMNEAFAKLRSKRVLQYHNITPPQFFATWDSEIYKILDQGQKGLVALAPVTTMALGDSEFNRAGLERHGFRKTGVLPIAIDFDRYQKPGNAALKSPAMLEAVETDMACSVSQQMSPQARGIDCCRITRGRCSQDPRTAAGGSTMVGLCDVSSAGV